MIVGLSGYAQVGKDTVGGMLVEERGFIRLAFADALKAVLYDLDPLISGGLLIRGEVDLLGWEDAKLAEPDVRAYLQRLGVAVREHVDPDAWVNAALRWVEPGRDYVITDVRFPNEAEAIKDRGGEVWRITRPDHGPANDHISELALDDWDFDRYIINDRTLDELRRRLTDVVAA